jgi:hypothetical protein
VAVICCLTTTGGRTPLAQFVWFDSAEEALEADRELLGIPCRRTCVGRHLVVLLEAERVRLSVHDPPPPSRESEMIACYGLPPTRVLPPPDPEYNEPLVEYAADTLAEWAADDASVAEGQVPTAVGTCEMDDADRWLAEHEEAMAL